MKRLLAYLFIVLGLGLVVSVKADNIRDFQIEGMSIGDSALDYLSIDEIKNGFITYGKDKSIYKLDLISNKFKQYDAIGFYFNKDDKNYMIKGIAAALIFDNFKKCKQKKIKVEKDISNIFNNVQKESNNYKHLVDNRSLVSQTVYTSKNMKGLISIACYKWHKNIKKNRNWNDHLAIEIYDVDTENWIRYLAF